MSETSTARGETGVQPTLSTIATRRTWVLTATMATFFMAGVEGTIVATATPRIVGDLGGFELVSWVFTVYLLTQAITVPIYGRLADLYGRKPILLIGIGLFLAGSVLCGFAWSMVSLICFRAAQGIGTGALVPVAMTIIGDLYTPAERARMQAYLSTVWSIAAVIGPVLGAFIVAHTIWAWIFWVNVPIALAAAILLATALREQVQPRAHRMNYLAVALLAFGLGALMFALTQAATLTTTTLAILIAVAVCALVILVLHERNAPEPILPLRLWRQPVIAGGAVGSFCVGAIMIGSSVFLSIYVQMVMDRTASVAAWVLMAMSVSWTLGSFGGGRLMLRTSYRSTIVMGAAWLAPGVLMLILLDPERSPVWAAVAGFLIGIGLGFTNNTFAVAVQASVDFTQRGVATSSTIFMRIMGQSLGAAAYGGILNTGIAGRVTGNDDMISRLLDPSWRRSLPPSTLAPLVTAVADALHNVYLIEGVVTLILLSTAFSLPAGLSPVRKTPGSR